MKVAPVHTSLSTWNQPRLCPPPPQPLRHPQGPAITPTSACAWLQGPAAYGPKLGGCVRVLNAVRVRGGASRLSCKTRMGVDKAEAANLEVVLNGFGLGDLMIPLTLPGRLISSIARGDFSDDIPMLPHVPRVRLLLSSVVM